MDRGDGASATLRKRTLWVDTAADAGTERGTMATAVDESAAVVEEPVTPTGRLFREPNFRCYIVSVLGLGKPVDLPAVRAGLAATLARHPRFCSVQVPDELDRDAKPKWVRTTVNLDDHIIVPALDPAATSADPDKALEDYVASLSARPMDQSRPLWELHVLDFPTAESAAAAALRMHHSLGDGVSLLSLFVACTRRVADRTRSRRCRPPAARGPCTRCRRGREAGAGSPRWRCGRWPSSCSPGTRWWTWRASSRRWRRSSATSARCSRARRAPSSGPSASSTARSASTTSSESDRNSITVRSALVVNLRPTPGLHTLARMMESGKDNAARWGNQIGYMVIPFHLAKHEDPIEYVRKAKQVARRKKSSMESIFTYWSADLIVKLFGIKASAALCYGMFTHTTLSFSNMVGPTEQVQFCGNPIVYIAPGTYGHPHALTVHYQSYMNFVKLVLNR